MKNLLLFFVGLLASTHVYSQRLNREEFELDSLNSLALQNYSIGNYIEAIRLGTKVLEIAEKTVGKKHSDYVVSKQKRLVSLKYSD